MVAVSCAWIIDFCDALFRAVRHILSIIFITIGFYYCRYSDLASILGSEREGLNSPYVKYSCQTVAPKAVF